MPLDDADRQPWLEELARWTRERHAAGESTVMTCSALKRSYRHVLREGVPATHFVHLVGSRELLAQRMSAREHFMPPELLTSQLTDLEPLTSEERGVVVDVAGTPEQVIAAVLTEIRGFEPRR